MVNRRQSRDESDSDDQGNGNKITNRKGSNVSDRSDSRRDNSRSEQTKRRGDDRDNLKKRDGPSSRNRKRSGSSDESDDVKGKNKKNAKFDSSEESGSESESHSQKSGDDKRRSNDNKKPGFDNSTFEVYFGDVSFNAEEDDIRAHFKGCGQILQIKLLTREDGKSRGRGFIKFADEKGMKNALKLNSTELMGRRIVVEQPANKAPTRGPGAGGDNQESSSVIVRNLPFNFGDNDLNDMFESFGSIKSFRVIKNESGQSKGFGFVDFESPADAKAALSKSGTDINGRSITVDFSLPKGDRPFNGGGRGGFGGGRGGFGGGRGGFRGGDRGGRGGRGGYGDRPQRGYRRDD